jgi:hypothetical protein
MEKNTNEITARGRRWLNTLEQDEQGRYVVPEDYARRLCDEKTLRLLKRVKAEEIGYAPIVVPYGNARGVVIIRGLGAIFASACGANRLYVGDGQEPLYDILRRSSDVVENAEVVAQCVLLDVEKAGAGHMIIEDVRKRILEEGA